MARIPDSELQKMIQHLPPREQQALGDIIAGRIAKRVKCLQCGNYIAEVYHDGKIRTTSIAGESWLLSYRPRLDGFTGFQCLCGNDSRLADAERGVSGIENNAVDRNTLEEVYAKLKGKAPKYPVTEDGQEIDGFLLENIE